VAGERHVLFAHHAFRLGSSQLLADIYGVNVINSAIESLRNHGGAAFRKTLVGDNAMDPSSLASPSDHGLFGPESVTWKINGDIAILVGGLRSLMYQTLHPLAMAGVTDHSDYRADPFGRLQRTSQFVGGTTFGNTAHAEQLIATVRKVHDRVEGTAPDGRPYRANDPRLLLWVHAVEVDSFLDSYKRYSLEPLEDWEADAYVAEMSVVAKRLGAEDLPLSVAELETTLQGFRPETKADRQARETWKFLLAPPLPVLALAPYGILAAAAVTSLPDWVLKDLKIPIPRGLEHLAVRPAAIALTKGLGWLMRGASTTGTLEERIAAETES
jgi:uncharacterized protein (DUF2236 family)